MTLYFCVQEQKQTVGPNSNHHLPLNTWRLSKPMENNIQTTYNIQIELQKAA